MRYDITAIALTIAGTLLSIASLGESWGSVGGFTSFEGGQRSGVISRHGDLPKLSRHLRYILFPETGAMGLFLALAIPLDLPQKSVSLSWNFEANYNLPYNASELAEPPQIFRDDGKAEGRRTRGAEAEAEVEEEMEPRSPTAMDRTRFYALLETHLRSSGLPARACLLRAICEAAETPLRHNGLVGDLMHVLLTPSSSVDEGLPPEFEEAENQGTAGKDCDKMHATCPVSVLDFVSVVVDQED